VKILTDSHYESNAGSQNQQGVVALEWGLREIVRLLYLHHGGDLPVSTIVQEELASIRRAISQELGRKRSA
jgi:hypothetical protein